MQTKRQILSVILVFIFILSLPFYSYAQTTESVEEVDVILPYVNISADISSITIKNNIASCAASITAKKSMSLSIKIELQQYINGKYQTIKTWTTSKTAQTLSMKQTYTVSSSQKYRQRTTFTAGEESETYNVYP